MSVILNLMFFFSGYSDDDDDSGGEEGRLNFSDIRSGTRDDMIRSTLGSNRGAVVTDDDQNADESDRWEKEQIRKGVATLVSI